MNNTDYSDFKPSEAFKKIKAQYDVKDETANETVASNQTTEENPVINFHKIRNEIDLIERDLEFYSNNVYIFL